LLQSQGGIACHCRSRCGYDGTRAEPGCGGRSRVGARRHSVIRDKQKDAKKTLGAAEVSYLYRMEQDLKPKDLLSWVKQGLLRFALNV